MQTLNASCKYCNARLSLNVDPEGFAMFTPETLASMAACNRCADFKEYQRRMFNRADRIATAYATGSKEQKAQALAAVVSLGKSWVNLLCQLYHLENQWSEDVGELLTSNMHRLEHALNGVQDVIRGQYKARKQERLGRIAAATEAAT